MVRCEQQSKFTLMPPLKENHHQLHHNNNSSTSGSRHVASAGASDALPVSRSNTSTFLENQKQQQQHQPSAAAAPQQSSGRPLPPSVGGRGVATGAFQGQLPPMKKSSSTAATVTTTTKRLVLDRQCRPPLLPLVDEMDLQKRPSFTKTPAENISSTTAAMAVAAAAAAENDFEHVVTACSVTNNNIASSSFATMTTTSSRLPSTTTTTSSAIAAASTAVRRGLLRYGERMEDLFGLDQDCSSQYWNDCQTLVDSSSVDTDDSAALWRSILDYASRYRCRTSITNSEENVNNNGNNRNLLSGQDLIKLHRRATSRLSSSSTTTTSSSSTLVVNENVLAIWLSYARAQLRYSDSMDDARLTLRHIQRWTTVNTNDNDDKSAASSKKDSMMLCNHPDYKQLMAELNGSNNNNNNNNSSISSKPSGQGSTLTVVQTTCSDVKDELKTLLDQKSPKNRACENEEFASLSPKRQKTEPTSTGCAHLATFSSSSFHVPPLCTTEEQSQCSDMSLETSQETLDADVSLELNDDNVDESSKNASVRFLLQPPAIVLPRRQMKMMMATTTATTTVSQRQEQSSISQHQHQPVSNQESNTLTVHEPTESLQVSASTQHGSANDKKSLLVQQQSCDQVEPQKNFTTTSHQRLGSASAAMLLPPPAVTDDHSQLPVSSAKEQHGSSSNTNGSDPSPAAENDKISAAAAAPCLSTETTTTKTHRSIVVGLNAAKSSDVVASATPSTSSTWLQNRPPRVTMLQSNGALKNQRRPPLLFNKAPGGVGGGVSRLGKLGKPKRVDPGTSSLDIDSGSDDDDTESSNVASASAASNNNNHKQSSKVPRMDLSYIYEWDPTKRSCIDPATTKAKEDKPGNESCSYNVKEKKAAPLLPKIEEGSTLAPEENSDTAVVAAGAVCKLDHDRQQDVVTTASSAEQPIITRNKENRMLADVNVDFLPLVSKKNILHVNGVPFAKLGVVGKGGSCKVYRVLSKECSVVAIKKVKLDGMDKRAIDSYANEINLLKSLRGNPAIIQMFDSQVDLQRKAIFVVMELGEVDLNQVLQQESFLADSKQSDNGEGRRLNLNFIRLTWEQMLRAVHSIHEARIIHGDLKPANFLFVRGGLKLIDFGIAKAMSNDNTTNIYRDSQIGTLNYMSPEAILDSGAGNGNKPKMKMGRASDIWSLGCILYQMVYGKTPFAELRMIPKLHAITDPDHCIDFPDYADPDAIDAMKKCLQRKPEERPPIVGGIDGLLDQHCFLHSARSRLRP